MNMFCLVLTGQLNHPGEAGASLAEAFAMDPESFHSKVWSRTPLIIRRALGEEMAAAQAARLESLGAVALVLPDAAELVWLRRGDHTRGPLPAPALARFAQAGDLWCRDGAGNWQAYPPPTAAPPPLPSATASPPPLPQPAVTRKPRRRLAWIGGILALVLVLVLASTVWHGDPQTASANPSSVTYTPRPLQPMPDASAAPASCRSAGPVPANDEDRYLVTGGQRTLTGRSQRQGDTYVAEAVSHVGANCDESTVQLYLFHHGGFIGPATPAALQLAKAHFGAFALVDPEHLHYAISRNDGSEAEATSALVKRTQGWTVRMDAGATRDSPPSS
jgi:hypothetical protein